MNRGFAGTVAVPAWADFMKKATEGRKAEWFARPSDVDRIAVCRKSGLRAAAGCRARHPDTGETNAYDDYFLSGTGPYETCGEEHMDPPNDVKTVLSVVF
jgi:membrane carboxypeptidase/penicillin-binding protein